MSLPISDKSPDKKSVTAFHRNDDLDSDKSAHHHTIGPGINQASSGKHNHQNGDGAPLLDDSVDILTGSLSGATDTVLGQVVVMLAKLGASNATTP
jgi:hypothetical protein